MELAYDHGVSFFDNAEIYARGKSEIILGKILKKMKWERTSYLVSSKVFFGDGGKLPHQTGLNRKHVMEACEAGTDFTWFVKVCFRSIYSRYKCRRPSRQSVVRAFISKEKKSVLIG